MRLYMAFIQTLTSLCCGKGSTPWGKNLIEIISFPTVDQGINSMVSF